MFSIAAAHRHREQRQGPCRRRQLGVRVRRERVIGLVAAAIRGGGKVVTHLVGALPLLERLGSNRQGASAHRQQHDERAEEQRHHRPEDAVQQDFGVVGVMPQHVVRPGREEEEEEEEENTVNIQLLIYYQ